MPTEDVIRLMERKAALVAELITATAAGDEAAMKSIIRKLSDTLDAIKAAEEAL
jgi:hypothetical protein